MRVVTAESAWLTKTDGHHTVAVDMFARALVGVLSSRNWNDQLVGHLVDKYANTYDDVRFFLYRTVAYEPAPRSRGLMGRDTYDARRAMHVCRDMRRARA